MHLSDPEALGRSVDKENINDRRIAYEAINRNDAKSGPTRTNRDRVRSGRHTLDTHAEQNPRTRYMERKRYSNIYTKKTGRERGAEARKNAASEHERSTVSGEFGGNHGALAIAVLFAPRPVTDCCYQSASLKCLPSVVCTPSALAGFFLLSEIACFCSRRLQVVEEPQAQSSVWLLVCLWAPW